MNINISAKFIYKDCIMTAVTIKSKRVMQNRNHNLIILPTTIVGAMIYSLCAIVTLTNEDGLPP